MLSAHSFSEVQARWYPEQQESLVQPQPPTPCTAYKSSWFFFFPILASLHPRVLLPEVILQISLTPSPLSELGDLLSSEGLSPMW